MNEPAWDISDHGAEILEGRGKQESQLTPTRTSDDAKPAGTDARLAREPADTLLEVLKRNLDQLGRQVLGTKIRDREHGKPARGQEGGRAFRKPTVGSANHEYACTRTLIARREEGADETVVANGDPPHAQRQEAALEFHSIHATPVDFEGKLEGERLGQGTNARCR